MKLFKFIILLNFAFIINSCSKKEETITSSCNDIVCGGVNIPGKWIIFRGTINPDTCGKTELTVNEATFNYYKKKWDANPEGYACWEGLK